MASPDLDILPLFPTLIGQAVHPGAAEINPRLAAYLLDCERREEGVAPRTTVRHGWQSELGLLDRDVDEIRALKPFFNRAIEGWLGEHGRRHHGGSAPAAFAYGYQGWAVILRRGGFQHQHVHSRTDLVGVYCVATPRGEARAACGRLTLIDPRGGRLANRPAWETDRVEIEPVPGRLVLFPSFLPHRVEEVRRPGERITINFDVTLRPAVAGGAARTRQPRGARR